MERVNLRTRTGPDGVLHVDGVSPFPNTDLDVVVILQPANRPPGTKLPREFFTEVVGGWKGEPLRREDEGGHEIRAVL